MTTFTRKGGTQSINNGIQHQRLAKRSRILNSAAFAVPLTAALGALSFPASRGYAATYVRANTAGSLNDTNWVPSGTPGSADIAQFNSTVTAAQVDTLGTTALTLGEIQIVNPGGAITVANDSSGSVLTLNGVLNSSYNNIGIDMSTATANFNYGSANDSLAIGAAQSWLVNSGSTLTINGAVSGSANVTLSGGGTVTLATTTNTFTGNYVVNSGMTLNENAAQSATSGVILNGGTLGGAVSLNGTNIIYANSGTSAVSIQAANSLFALFAGNGNIAWNVATLNNVTQGNTVAASIFGNFGGTVAWGSSGNSIRMQAQSSAQGQYTLNPFANFDLGSGGGALTAKLGSTAWLLGGLQGTSATDSVGGTAGGHASAIIVGGANLSQTYAGTFLNTSGDGDEFYKIGLGTLTLTGIDLAANVHAAEYATDGFSNAVLGGTLLLNHSVNPTGLLATASTFEIGQGGSLTVLGNTGASTGTTETVASLTANNGGGNLILTPNGGLSTTVSVGAITASAAGALLNITENTGTATLKTTSTLTNSILGAGHVTFTNSSGVTGYATTTGTTPFTVAQYTGATVYSTGAGSATTNYKINDNASVTSGAAFYTLQVTNDTAGQTLTFGGTFIDTTGSILFTGPNAETITGGTINTSLIIQNYGATLTYNNAVTGSATMTFGGPGTTILGGGTSNTYTGLTYIDTGATLSIASNATLGAPGTGATINLFGGTLQATGGTAFGLFNGTAGTNNRNIIIGGGGGTIDTTSGTTLTVAGVISNTTEDGAISSYGPLIKTDSGKLVLSNPANTYSGATIINGGVLSVSTLANGNVVSSIGNAPSTANALILNGGTLQYTGGTTSTDRTFTVGTSGATFDASGSGPLTFSNSAPIVANTTVAGSGNRALTLTGSYDGGSASATNAYKGQIVDGTGGYTSVVKSGSGSWTLTNSSHTYTGSTLVTQGTLYLAAPSSINPISSSSTISVASGATLDVTGLAGGGITLGSTQTLTGSGTINGAVTAPIGSTVAPGSIGSGSAGSGTLITGTLNAAAGSMFTFGLSSANTDPFTTGASIVAPANLVLPSSGTVTVNFYQPNTSIPFAAAGTYDLFSLSSISSNLSGGAVASAFSVGAATNNSAFLYTFGTSGNDITVTLVQNAVAGVWALNGNGVWDTGTPGNWTGGVPNLAGSTATFGTDGGAVTASPVVTLDQNQSVGGMTFSAPQSYSINSSGGVLTLDNKGAGASISVSAGTANLISAPVSLNDNLTVTVGSGTFLGISGNIQNTTNPQTISFAGAGTLLLSGSNTYGPSSSGTVGTTITGTGTLQVGNNTALGAGDLAISAGGTLQAGAAGLSLANNISIGAATTAIVDTQANTLTLNGVISDGGSGTGGLTKIGSGTLILGSNETYGGTTTVSNGTLQLGNGGSGAGSVSGNIVDNAAVTLNRTDSYTLGNVISGNGTLTQIGSGNITLSAANTFSGNTVISAGSITLGNGLALQNSTLNYNGQGGNLSFGTLTTATLGGLSGSQNLALLNTTPAAVALSVGNNAQNTTYSGSLSGAGASLNKVGSGTLTLTGVNSYTGNTSSNGGSLIVGVGGVINGAGVFPAGGFVIVTGGNLSSSALSTANQGYNITLNSGSVELNAGYSTTSTGGDGAGFIMTGGTLTATSMQFQRTNNTGAPNLTTFIPPTIPNYSGFVATGGTATIGSLSIATITNSSSTGYIGGSANVTVTGEVLLGEENNTRWNYLQVAGGSFTDLTTTPGSGMVIGEALGGATTGSSIQSELYLTGGTTTLGIINFGTSGDANGGTGALVVNGGTLYVGSGGIVKQSLTTGANLLTDETILTAGTIGAIANWSSAETMQLNGTNFTFQAANASGGAENITLTGVLGGTGGLVKTGAGTLTLNSSGNTYTGLTTINAGILNINSEYALGGGNYSGLTFNGGTLQYANPLLNATTDITNIGSAKPVTINAGGATIDLNGNDVNFASSIGNNGTGSLVVKGGGTLNVSGGTYTGSTTIIGGTVLYANVASALAPASAYNVSVGVLDVTAGAQTVGALTVASTGTLNLSYGSILTVTGTANFAGGALNLLGTATAAPGAPETLIAYNLATGTFAAGSVTGVPSGDNLAYTGTALELVVTSSGPATLTWNNGGGPGNGTSWDTSSLNWNNGSASVAFSNTSNGTSGDNVIFANIASPSTSSYTVNVSGTVNPTSTLFTNTAGNNYNITGGTIAGPGALTLTGGGTVTLSNSNTYTGGTNVSAGKLVLASANAFPSGTANAGSGLIVASGATVQIANHGTSAPIVPFVSSISNSGTIDLTNNAMVLKGASASIGTITSEVAAAYNGGTWTGTNSSIGVITSSVAAGDNSHLTAVGVATGLTTFQGGTVSTSDVLLKYTYYGDANLDGHVDGSDYSRIDNGVLMHLSGWSNGDFNYDGVINGSDYTLIDNAFNTQGASLAAETASPDAVATAQIAGVSAVPEPTTLGLLGIGAVGLLGRRRRR